MTGSRRVVHAAAVGVLLAAVGLLMVSASAAAVTLPGSAIIATMAGTGTAGFSGDTRGANQADLQYPYGVAVDGSGDMFIADTNNNRVRKVTPGGVISTVAGTGTPGYSVDNVQATTADLNYPRGVAVDGSGDVFIADTNNNRVRLITPDGVISTVAGTGTPGYSVDNVQATTAQLRDPAGVAINGSGDLFIADSGNQRVRKVTPNGVIGTVAGDGTGGYFGDNGAATTAQLSYPQGVAVDSSGNLFIADTNNSVVRKVTPDGVISTVAGTGTYAYFGDNGAATGAGLDFPFGVAVDGSATMFVADTYNNRVRAVGAASPAASPPTPTPTPTPTPAPDPDREGPGSQLAAGESITSAQYSLVMQGDGNLVEYGNGRPLWSSGTAGVTGAHLVVQSDGNVVVYSGSGAAVWSTGTWGHSQPSLVIQPDGNLVVYTASGAAWVNGAPGSGVLTPGGRLTSGQYIHSGSWRYSLVMQGDGNLVEYDSTRGAVWASWTYVAGSFLVEQSDGNAVVYTPSGKPVWASNTFGSNPSLDMQNDGNLVAYYGNSARLIN